MAKSNLPARAGAQLPANWEAQLAADAAKAKDAEASTGGGSWLSTRNGILSFQNSPIPGGAIEVVVVDSPPVCYAISESDKDLVPAENVMDRQADECRTCEQNVFGTSERGKGKACKNMRRLALLHTDYLKPGADLDRAPLIGLKVPPTSLIAWAEHVRKLANVFNKPPYCFITKITVTPDPKVQIRIAFELVAEVKDRKLLGAIYARRADAAGLLEVGYEPAAAEPPAQPARRHNAPSASAMVRVPTKTKKEKPVPTKEVRGGFGKF
jgi:hypothetical protein